MNIIECRDLTKTYGNHHALEKLSLSIEDNKITGLIGRNGAGKTTLLKILAGFIHQTSGDVHVFSENPFNNLKVSANMIFIDDNMNPPSTMNLIDLLDAAASFYPNFDKQFADRLFNYFSFHPKQTYQSLSKGMKSTFNMIIGLSARCALTIFDEPTTGMDSAVRKDFYRALLKDYMAYPRTIILSSHLLNELEAILEDVVLLKDGKPFFHLPISKVKEYAIALSGEKQTLSHWTAGKEVIHQKDVGIGSTYLVIKNELTKDELDGLRRLGVEVSPVSPDDLCVYVTNKTKGGIDDVFNRD